jgi:hypothetical protein
MRILDVQEKVVWKDYSEGLEFCFGRATQDPPFEEAPSLSHVDLHVGLDSSRDSVEIQEGPWDLEWFGQQIKAEVKNDAPPWVIAPGGSWSGKLYFGRRVETPPDGMPCWLSVPIRVGDRKKVIRIPCVVKSRLFRVNWYH